MSFGGSGTHLREEEAAAIAPLRSEAELSGTSDW
jgi:hypothetical protein